MKKLKVVIYKFIDNLFRFLLIKCAYFRLKKSNLIQNLLV